MTDPGRLVVTNEPIQFGWIADDGDGTPQDQLLYATKLEPLEREFSAFTAATGKTIPCAPNGNYTMFVKAKDEANNESPAQTFEFAKEVPDNTLPTARILEGPTGVRTSGSVSFKWEGADKETPSECLDYAVRLLNRDTDFSPFGDAVSRDYTDLTDGDYTFEVKALDLARQESPVESRSFTVRLPDTTRPETTISAGPTGRITTNEASFEWAGSDGGNSAGSLTYAFRLDPIEPNFSAFGGTTRFTYPDLAKGSYTFFVKARDQAGNEDDTPAQRAFTVEDANVASPTVTVMPNVTNFRATETMRVDSNVENAGGAVAVDIYFGAVLPASVGPGLGCPRRDAIALVAEDPTGPKLQLTCLSTRPQDFRPWRRDVMLPGAQDSMAVSNFRFTWAAGVPPGTYLLFVALTPTGVLQDGEIGPTDILALGTKEITFSP